ELTRQCSTLAYDFYSYGRRLLGLRFSASGRYLTQPLNLPAPCRCQPLYFAFLASQRPVFLINSPLGLFTAAYSKRKHPFSLSYGVMLPSSLRRVLPVPFGYSPSLPVTASGNATRAPTRTFSCQCGIMNFVNNSLPITARAQLNGFSYSTPKLLGGSFPSVALSLSSSVTPLLKQSLCVTGISTSYP